MTAETTQQRKHRLQTEFISENRLSRFLALTTDDAEDLFQTAANARYGFELSEVELDMAD